VGSVGARTRGRFLRAHENQLVLAAPHPAPAFRIVLPALSCTIQNRAAVMGMLLADDESGSAGAFALRDTITIPIPGWADA
jgi:hypothetical protein